MSILESRKAMKSWYHTLKVTDQKQGKPQPEVTKKERENTFKIKLPKPDKNVLMKNDLMDAMLNRRSHRKFLNESLSLEELSYMLLVTQGVRQVIKRQDKSIATYRYIPSAGARHPFETYIAVQNVEGLDGGLYHYLPLTHELELYSKIENFETVLTDACLGQIFVGKSAATLIWATIAYRAEWRYSFASHKGILLDAGHICQNLYLACETIGCGTCAIAAYDQEKVDALIEADGENEFTVYLAPVGKIEEGQHEKV